MLALIQQHSRSAFCWAREALTQAGFTFVCRDVYDRDHPFGTIAV